MSTTGDSERLAERFLQAFSKIETFLRNKAPDQMGPASELIMLVGDHNTDVRRYRDKLLQLTRIRNPLVHERLLMSISGAAKRESQDQAAR